MSDEQTSDEQTSDEQVDGAGETAKVDETATGAPADAEAPAVTGKSARAAQRHARRVEKASEKAARAQRKADEARRQALAAVRAGGFLDVPDEPAPTRPVPASTTGPKRAAEPEWADEPKRAAEPETAAPGDGTGTAKATPARGSTTAPVAADASGVPEDVAAARARRSRRLLPVLAVALVALVALTAVSSVEYVSARDKARQQALAGDAQDDAAAAAKAILVKMFTFDYNNVDTQLDAVEPDLVGKAETEFRTTSKPAVTQSTKDQQASVYASVSAIAPLDPGGASGKAIGADNTHVILADADHVTLLAMLNRMVSTKDQPQAQSAQSRLWVTMQRVGGQWKLADLTSV